MNNATVQSNNGLSSPIAGVEVERTEEGGLRAKETGGGDNHSQSDGYWCNVTRFCSPFLIFLIFLI